VEREESEKQGMQTVTESDSQTRRVFSFLYVFAVRKPTHRQICILMYVFVPIDD